MNSLKTMKSVTGIKIDQRLGIVIPLFNEAEMLPSLLLRLEQIAHSVNMSIELILVDDGSTDSTWKDICNYSPQGFDLNGITLSRNFGKEAALSSGLKAVTGDAAIILDADCQDPPELIPLMLKAWHQGVDVVNMKRRSRAGESWFKRKTAALYYRLLGSLSETPIPENVGDFRLMSRRVLDEVNRLDERNRYMKGILSWPGFKQTTLEYDRDPRTLGQTKWNYWQLLFLAISGITAFSNKPLRLASWIGSTVALSSFVYGLWVLIRTLVYGDAVSGYPSMMVAMLFLGGVQLITIGILGEYVGRIFTEVKGRPSYIVSDRQLKPGMTSAGLLRAYTRN